MIFVRLVCRRLANSVSRCLEPTSSLMLQCVDSFSFGLAMVGI